MQKTVMKLQIRRCYHITYENNYGLWALAMFLTGDIGNGDSFLDWAKDPEQNNYGGNISALRKKNGKILLYLPMDYEDYEADPETYSLTMPVETFIYILEEWHRLALEKSQYIIITRESDEFKIFASDTNPEPVIS